MGRYLVCNIVQYQYVYMAIGQNNWSHGPEGIDGLALAYYFSLILPSAVIITIQSFLIVFIHFQLVDIDQTILARVLPIPMNIPIVVVVGPIQ